MKSSAPLMFPLVLCALFLFGYGGWQVASSTDELWRRHERFLLARGLAPQRSPEWERSARWRGWAIMAIGFVMLMPLYALVSTTAAPKMSGVRINGREVSQAEWDACGHDSLDCMMSEAHARDRRGQKQPDEWVAEQ